MKINSEILIKFIYRCSIPEGWKFRLLTIDDKAEVDSKVQREGTAESKYIEFFILK